MTKQLVFSCLILFIISACSNERLTLVRDKDLLRDDVLKTNGYYFNVTSDSVNGPWTHYYCLYKNGIWRHLSNVSGSLDVALFEKNLSKLINISSATSKSNWGVFKIKNNLLQMQMWFTAVDMPVQSYSGSVLNDTTFTILQSNSRMFGIAHTKDTFHFKQFDFKPDSLNLYIPSTPN